MMLARTTSLVLIAAASVAGLALGACAADGEDGKAGAVGAPGPQGPAGPAGPGFGDGGTLSGPCTTPCHTFNGVVDQWRLSHHSHPQKSDVGGGSCGNCHAIDGLSQRVAGNVVVAADASAPTNVQQGHINYVTATGAAAEVGYGGSSVIGRIHCTTCHDFNATNDPHVTGKYTAGQAPLRVPGGQDGRAYMEASQDGGVTGTALAYGSANTCVFCHKSRKDVSAYVTPTNNRITSTHWGPHDGPQTDIYSGQGGYEFAGKGYGTSTHTTIANKCVTCHMPPVAANGNVPDHSMKPQIATCKTAGCHAAHTGTSFDVLGGRTSVQKALFELQRVLNEQGFLTRAGSAPYAPLEGDQLTDGQFQLDLTKPGKTETGPRAGALYNYLLVARGKDLGVHNPVYTKQLLVDSIEVLGGDTSVIARPPAP